MHSRPPTRFEPDDRIGAIGAPTRDARPSAGDGGADSTPSDAIIKTGTTTVGLAGADGAVLAADARASLGGQFVTNKTARKIEPVADRTAVAFSGSVSDAQSFVRHLRAELSQYDLERDGPASVETAATVAGDLVRRGPYRILDLVLAGVDDEPAVYQIGGGGGVMEAPYAASGSGMQLAYGALEAAYQPDRSVAELRPIAARAVRSAAERDTASGDGMTIATITDDDLAIERYDDLERAVSAVDSDENESEGAI
ncbi:proteasome subunit alpha [Halopiger aswanensis]|uniref:proteasome endopeptidase complex n=1 Tax=Halopiger aswanensis TaxID=148449 RepID=A0A3R7E1C5_9EURY|nr:proteasome subunit alpha [Halopiger aswanensis]RKD97639.1 proteasome endopeptidase complex beta subunit [Halopiger aswanensis]